MKKFITVAATSVALLASASAFAAPIEGVINFTGGASIFESTTTTGTIGTITFTDASVNLDPTDTLVTGSFDGLESSVATFTDIVTADATPYSLWTVGSFTFTIANIDSNIFSNNFYVLGGEGTITSSDPAYDETAGTWIITANGTGGQDVSFSSTSTAVDVPAPAGAALLGLSLLGFGFARRNKKS